MTKITIREFLGDPILDIQDWKEKYKNKNERWNCIEKEYDASLYDENQRVFKKYMETVVGFNDWYDRSLQELEDIVKPPLVNKNGNNRTIILGTTEYLSPYLAYCLNYIKENKNKNKNKILPFIFFSLTEWTEEKNVQYIDCISYRKKGKIITILPKNREEWHPFIYIYGNPTT